MRTPTFCLKAALLASIITLPAYGMFKKPQNPFEKEIPASKQVALYKPQQCPNSPQGPRLTQRSFQADDDVAKHQDGKLVTIYLPEDLEGANGILTELSKALETKKNIPDKQLAEEISVGKSGKLFARYGRNYADDCVPRARRRLHEAIM